MIETIQTCRKTLSKIKFQNRINKKNSTNVQTLKILSGTFSKLPLNL